MNERRLVTPPGLVVAAALAGTFAFLGIYAWLHPVTQDEVVLGGLAGASGAAAAGIAALVRAWLNRQHSDVLIKAEHDSRHDALTGLTNRNALFVELQRSIANAKKTETIIGVMFLDLDRFKVINDSMGHEAGDELLRIVANRIKRAVRGSDVVARFGGDEFVVVCRDLIHERSVTQVADAILASFAEPVSLHGGAQTISGSIGVAIAHPDDPRDPEALIRDADAAMYKAKRDRSGYAVFDEIQRKAVLNRLDIERDLNDAFDDDQLVVYYQPIVDVRSKRLYGFEALVRWNHPTRGVIPPSAFLDVAEEIGMMSRIGELVLREACAQATVWNHLSPDAREVKMSVNVAEQQLLDANFPALVKQVLDWSGLPPDQLVLEIVEDTIVDHLADGLSRLREIRQLGVNFAIDDFGTGQSSLSYVKQFDMVSTLKIDKVFVDEMSQGKTNQAIIEAIVAMAKALDLRVVAEGVESNDQVRALLGFNIGLMQGYLFNRPIAASAINPSSWFKPREAPSADDAAATPGLTPLEVSRGFVEVGSHHRPARRGSTVPVVR